MSQTQTVVFSSHQSLVDLWSSTLPVHVEKHLTDGNIVKTGGRLDTNLHQQFNQQCSVVC